jgi:malate dehydrogenase
MTMLDENRGRTQLAHKAGTLVEEVRNLAIWGNHSATQYPDVYNATIGGEAAARVINDEAWIQGEFLTTVQQRGAEIIKARGASSAASAANAVVDTVRNITQPTGEQFSAAIPAPGDGSGYGVPDGIVFGYPLRATGPGRVSVVQGVQHGEWGESKIQATLNELLEEREAVKDLLP